MPRFTSFAVSGFRALAGEVRFVGLAGQVILYGDNAVGKSSVLEALRLFSRLASWPARELLYGAWQAEIFYNRFEVDADIFHRGFDQVRFEGATADGALTIVLHRSTDGSSIVVSQPDTEVGRAATALREAEEAVRLEARDQVVTTATQDLRNMAGQDFEAALAACEAGPRPIPSVGLSPGPTLPVPAPLRAALATAWGSLDPGVRARARACLKGFSSAFPALGEGAMEPTDNPPRYPRDFAWFGEGVALELDRLGGGVQSTFATLAILALAREQVVCLEEPEAFVGERAFPGLRAGIQAAVSGGALQQVWVATHAVSLADDQASIFILDRSDGTTTARRAGPDELQRFSPEGPPPRGDRLGRLGVDGSVRLPEPIRERLGLKAGDFLYAIEEGEGFRFVNGEELQRLLGGDE